MSAQRVHEFDLWRPKYGGAVVRVTIAGTTTLADLFYDEALTETAENPQTLLSLEADAVVYGKFEQPIYTASPYQLDIASTDQTGIQRPPITDMTGVDVGSSVATSSEGSASRTLADRFSDVIRVEDFGEIGTSAATNTATLELAIGAAGGAGGGQVVLPAGTIVINPVTLPAGVILRGQGRAVTVLQCTAGDDVVTLGGDRCGLADLTLDGVNLVTASVGVYALAKNETVFRDVEIKRFDTGLRCRGGRRSSWRDLFITNCATGIKLQGDNNTGLGDDGDEFRHNSWIGGRVQQCTTSGISLEYIDKLVSNNSFAEIEFSDNTGTAVIAVGTRYITFSRCYWNGNTVNIDISDDDDTSKEDENTVVHFVIDGGAFDDGEINLTDTLESVIFEGVFFGEVTLTLTEPVENSILLQDCTEEDLTIEGDGTKLCRWRRTDQGATSGITTDATATKAWSYRPKPGQVAYLDATVIANQRNGIHTAEYHVSQSVKCAGSSLAYDTQTADFTLGDIVTGETSGATARITADSDSGTYGTLTIRDITGEFLDNETITDPDGGSATVNGTQVDQNPVLLGSLTSHYSHEDNGSWAVAFVANGPEIELRVTGAANQTIDWLVDVRVTQS